jgi:hypothetical protein
MKEGFVASYASTLVQEMVNSEIVPAQLKAYASIFVFMPGWRPDTRCLEGLPTKQKRDENAALCLCCFETRER